MRRGIIVLLLFIVVVGGILGVSQLIRQQPPLEITIAVDPLGADWVRSAAETFNAGENLVGTRRIQIVVQEVSDVDVWRGEAGWRADNHPDGWIPSSTVSLDYATTLRFQSEQESLARTSLVWGGFVDRVNVITGGTQPLDWAALGAAAAEGGAWESLPNGNRSWGFIKFAFPTPERSMVGVAALFSGAADYADTMTLTGTDTSSTTFRSWMLPIVQSVPNFQTLGADPVATIASRGTSVVDIALLPESEWLTQIRSLDPAQFQLSYPEFQFEFDFPLASWSDTQTLEETRSAVAAFGTYLMSEAQQVNLMNFGLRPAASDPTGMETLFAAGQPFGITAIMPQGLDFTPPSRSDAQSLIQWFIQAG